MHTARDAPDVREPDAARRPRRAESLRGEREATRLARGEFVPGLG
jgi:hypothetical protein